MSEIDISSKDFNPNHYKIDALIRILSKYDVDLPPKRQKKDFYVSLFQQHLEYMKKRLKSDQNSTKEVEFAVPYSPKRKSPRTSPRRTSRGGPSTPIIALKKRAIFESDSESVFSDENPFQASLKPKSMKKHIFKPVAMQLESSVSDIEVKFSKSVPKFSQSVTKSSECEVSPPKLSDIMEFKSQKHHSPPSTKKRTPSSSHKQGSPSSRSKQHVKIVEKPLVYEYSPEESINSDIKKDASEERVLKKKSLQERLLERKRAKQAQKLPSKILGTAFSIFVFLFANWLAIDQPKLSYCTADTNASMLFSFLPNCVECPNNAICKDRKIVRCTSNEYKIKRSSLEFFLPSAFLPFPIGQSQCVFDTTKLINESKKMKQTEHLIQVVDEIVREYMGALECSRNWVPKDIRWVYSSKVPNKPLGIPINSAKESLKKLIESKWDDKLFEDYWNSVLDMISQQKEGTPIYSIMDDTHFKHRLLVSRNPPIYSLNCRLQRQIWKFSKKYSFELFLIAVLLLSSLYLNQRYQARQLEYRISNILIDDVIEAIHEEYEFYNNDSSKHQYPGLPISQLTNHFLPRTKPPSKKDQDIDHRGRSIWYLPDEQTRTNIWNKVRSEILKNSNIRETNVQIKGEAQIIWMWIGSKVLSPLKRRTDFETYGTISKKEVAKP